MAENKRKLLMLLTGVLFVAMLLVARATDPLYRQIRDAGKSRSGAKESGELMVQLPGQFIFATFSGFKEVIAGALWVRADSFFHTGQFEAIVPLVRLVTWLDPHNIDVYTTGAWHLDYNFVDKNEMSDKRYIPASIALLQEGIENNPDTWDLYFDLGWTHYNKKLNDYENGLKYIKLACERQGRDPNTGREAPRPAFVDRMLAHQYEKIGDFDNAIKEWERARQRGIELSKDKRDTMSDQLASVVCDRNLSLLYLRLGWRYGNMDAYKKGVEIMQQMAAAKDCSPDALAAAKGAAADYAKRVAANNPPRDTMKPIDLGFDVKFEKIRPRVFRIKGTINLIRMSEYKGLAAESVTGMYAKYLATPAKDRNDWVDGARVNWMLTDADNSATLPNNMAIPKTFTWKLDKTQTVQWDSIPISGGKFQSEPIDLSGNERFYPFKAKKYKLTVWMTPREPNCDDTVRDRIGWKGEALTDKRYLNTTMLPGYKCVKWETILDREDLM